VTNPVEEFYRASVFHFDRYVVCSDADIRRKIVTVGFTGDGSVYVDFQYCTVGPGLLGAATIPTGVQSARISLTKLGFTTQHRVKFTHHASGEALFSKTGRIYTKVRRQAAPLSEAYGHLFSLFVWGPADFMAAGSRECTSKPWERKVLVFPLALAGPQPFKIVGMWHWTPRFLSRAVGKVNASTVCGLVPYRSATSQSLACLLGPRIGHPPLSGHFLSLQCEPLKPNACTRTRGFTFVGGFDKPVVTADKRNPLELLIADYPSLAPEETLAQLECVDWPLALDA
jgi:hypothetical protein